MDAWFRGKKSFLSQYVLNLQTPCFIKYNAKFDELSKMFKLNHK